MSVGAASMREPRSYPGLGVEFEAMEGAIEVGWRVVHGEVLDLGSVPGAGAPEALRVEVTGREGDEAEGDGELHLWEGPEGHARR